MIQVAHLSALALDVLGSQSFTRRRRSGSYVNGDWVDGTAADTAGTGTVVPARGRDVLRLDEGLRSSEAIKVITRTDLRTGDPDAATMPDDVVFNGATYRVQHVERWQQDSTFVDAVCVRTGS